MHDDNSSQGPFILSDLFAVRPPFLVYIDNFFKMDHTYKIGSVEKD
jgi:hypothetical protein